MKFAKYLGTLVLAGALTSCGDEYLEPRESAYVSSDQVQETAKQDPDKVFASQMAGVYANWTFSLPVSTGNIMDHMNVGWAGLMMLSDVMSNDMSLDMDGDPWGYDHQLDYYAEQYVRARQPWNFFYTVIKASNDMINQIDPTTENETLKAYLGQALAFRGVSYFYLAQFFQHTYATSQNMPCVPLYLSNSEESIYSRATVQQVFDRAELDLCTAETLLANFKRASKSEIDQQVVQGLLSRLYLVKREWAKAAEKAKAAREGYNLMTVQQVVESDYQDVTNPEVIWGVDVTTSTCRIYASFQSWMSAQSVGYGGEVGAVKKIDQKLYDNIPVTDARKYLYYPEETQYESWTLPALANMKFKYVAEFLGDYVYMRAAEMYLTEAEALVMDGKTAEAQQVLAEFMVTREPTWAGSATKNYVRLQRRIELWGEGFGYFDHRRWQMDMNRGYEGSNDNPSAWPVHEANGFVPWWHFSWRYQIPLKEIQENENISEADQNPVGVEGNQDPSLKLD
ncbi:MAG: RagB/SusD family nutrient uptake outer membrane protein [Bacteroidaceae bacterium]|nr:RagB/SusD family nutrient uptake outer membrane protein [Bacteroidaceae bacterium]